MRAALRRRNEIDVTLGQHLAAVRQPEHGPVRRLVIALHRVDERPLRQRLQIRHRGAEIAAQPFRVAPVLHLTLLVGQRDCQPGTQHCLGAQQMLEPRQRQLGCIEIARIGGKAHARAGDPARHRAGHDEVFHLVAVRKPHAVGVAAALHFDFERGRQRVHHGHSHAVQTAGELVLIVVEFAAGMQPREDEFDAGHAMLRVDVHRHAAAVVLHFDAAVAVQPDVDALRVSRQRLVNAVVDNFLHQMIGPGRVRVHPGPLANRFQARQHLNRFGRILFVHRHVWGGRGRYRLSSETGCVELPVCR